MNESQYLELYNQNIENELKNITNKESKISLNNKGLKEELYKLKITKQANSHYQEECDTINKNIKIKENEIKNVEIKLEKIKKVEKKAIKYDDITYLHKIKKAIENIYDDNNKIDEEISLLNTVIINKFQI